ncbi:hypothetical protein PDJAM_G00243820 [Pangasius djambal]|uniref:Uncharacterized protein n=1 Tax=Pangasius djambal TaxID=1691987 RepID=A0ACC5YHM0_9TELE|nr:hypothetical protein [Pangasius djambal]
MKVLSSHLCGVCFLFMWTIRSTSVLDVSGTHQGIPPAVVKLWASAFGGEMKSIAAKYSGSQLLQKWGNRTALAPSSRGRKFMSQ